MQVGIIPVRLTPDVSSATGVSSSPVAATTMTEGAVPCAEIVRGDGQIRVPVSAGADFIASLYAALNVSDASAPPIVRTFCVE